jgi:CRP-like cAMP-binding protein
VDPARILLGTSIFRGQRPEDVAELLPHLRERRFARGEPVWLEGDAAEALYVVAQGQLKSHRVSRDGAEIILRLHPAGDCTGEVGLFHPTLVRQVSVSAMEPSICLLLPRAPLVAFLAEHPAVMLQLLEQLSVMAVASAYSFSGVAFDDIRTRVAVALRALAQEFGEPADGGVRIRLRLSQTALAALVAASRENVNRALSSLISAGTVSQSEGHFYVHDLTALAEPR